MFGQQRLWGSVGWGLASILSGILVDFFSDGTAEKNFTAMFYVMLVFMILEIAVSCKLEVTFHTVKMYTMHKGVP